MLTVCCQAIPSKRKLPSINRICRSNRPVAAPEDYCATARTICTTASFRRRRERPKRRKFDGEHAMMSEVAPRCARSGGVDIWFHQSIHNPYVIFRPLI